MTQMAYIKGFEPTTFKDVKFMTAREKEQVLKAWELFLKNGCKAEHFTERLYHHLMQHCSFIAHYDRAGFYDTYFANGGDTAHFLTQFDRTKGCVSVEYGMTYWIGGGNDVCAEYYDINNAMVDVAAKYILTLTSQANERQKQADLTHAYRILAKHGINRPGGSA